jgi:hypothetical protein
VRRVGSQIALAIASGVEPLCEAIIFQEILLETLELTVEEVAGLINQTQQRVGGDLWGRSPDV